MSLRVTETQPKCSTYTGEGGCPFQEHPRGVEREGGQAGGHRAKATCSAAAVSVVLCRDSPSCHFLGDWDRVAAERVP